MEGKVHVLARSGSLFAGGQDELTFRGVGQIEKTEYGHRLRYTAQNELDGSGVASEIRLENARHRAVVITESQDGGYGLLLDPKAETGWHLPRKGTGRITLRYTLFLGTQPMSELHLELTLTKEENN